MTWIQEASKQYREYKADGGAMVWQVFLAVLKEQRELREAEEAFD
jgi:hypothetical protein